jgi:hypothetical protein
LYLMFTPGLNMRVAPPQALTFTRDSGLPNSVVHTSILGTRLDTVTALTFLGSGILAAIVGSPSDNTLDLVISIAANAAPGPRTLSLSFTTGGFSSSETSGPIFYVLAPSAYAGMIGIGSHLI